MLSEELQERLVEQLVDRIEDLNLTILTEIGKQIKYIGTLTPSQAHKLSQMIMYGENMNKIARELAKITNLSVQDIYKIFKQTAIENQEFARQFYKAKGVKFVPYSENIPLQKEVKAIAKITANTYKNLMKSTAYVLDDRLVPIGKIYQEVLDKAILSVSQGKEAYSEIMRKTMQNLADNGMRIRLDKNGKPTGTRVIDFKSGRSVRADSQIRMNLLDGVRTLFNELQKQFGDEYGADGIEISHHQNSAPDHIDTIDGKQFARIDVIKEQILDGTQKNIKLNDIKDDMVKVNGKWYKDFDSVNNKLERPVSTLNCRHYTFSIVLGVSKPEYTEEQLKADKERNLKGFEYNGKHYTLYEGTQLQRRMETRIRQYKDRQIVARSMGDADEIGHCQRKITEWNYRYKTLCNASGLRPKMERMRVSGYQRVKVG